MNGLSTLQAESDAPVTLSVAEDQIAILTLNRPGARNAVNAAMTTCIESTLRQIEQNDAIRVVIITGAGDRAFCAGADLKEVAVGGLAATFTADGGFAGFVTKPRSKPWIAAVNGFALAGGFEIVLACDMVVASRHALFGLPEVRRGLIASGGGLYRLPRMLSKAIAIELIATGKTISAERAFNLGLINEVTEPDQVIETAMALAREICESAPLAVRESIGIARLASSFEDPILQDVCDHAQERLSKTSDFKEGSKAFVEKRPAKWRGE